MSIQARGAQDIRTHSTVLGSGSHSNERHVHQFQLAALELERTRRTRERTAVLRRLEELEVRLAEIDDLMLQRREALGLAGGGQLDLQTTAVRAKSGEQPAEPRRVLRY